MESEELDANEKENTVGVNGPVNLSVPPSPSHTGVEIEVIEDQENDVMPDASIPRESGQRVTTRSPLMEKVDAQQPSHLEGSSRQQANHRLAENDHSDGTDEHHSLSTEDSSDQSSEVPANENVNEIESIHAKEDQVVGPRKEVDTVGHDKEQPDISTGSKALPGEGGPQKESEQDSMDVVNIVNDLAKGDESCVERPGIFGLMAKSDIFNPHSCSGQATEDTRRMGKSNKDGKNKEFTKEQAQDIKYTIECLEAALPTAKKLPLKEEIIGRPPFRFIHDVAMAILGRGMFTKEEADAYICGESKIRKLAWLAKLREIVQIRTKSKLDVVRLGKVVAGKEVRQKSEPTLVRFLTQFLTTQTANTRFLLRMICKAGEEEVSQLNTSQSPTIRLPNASEILTAAESDPNRRRSMLALQTHLAEKAEEIKTKKLRINVNMDLLDGELQQAVITRLNLLQSICLDPSSKGHDKQEGDWPNVESTNPHAILLEHHIRTVASAYSMANQVHSFTKSQSLRRLSDPQEGNGQRNGYLRQATHLYISPFDKPVGHDEVRVDSLPRIIFDKNTLSCLCVLSLTRLGLRNSAFPEMPCDALPTFLTVLDFSHNFLTDLPKIFTQCWKLVELSLRDNEIAAVDVGNFKCLVLLDLRKNLLTTKPQRLDQCSKLRYLYIKDGQPIKFPVSKAKRMVNHKAELCSDEETRAVAEEVPVKASPVNLVDQPECLDLSDSDILNTLKTINLKQVMVVAINVDRLLAQGTVDGFIPGKDDEVFEILLRFPNVWQFWVYSGEFSFTKQALKDEGVHYLGLKPYDRAFDPPVYLPLLHRWLMQGFDIVNCALCKHSRLCKFTIIPLKEAHQMQRSED